MSGPRLQPLRPPIAFAHRGARAHADENTIEAFDLALRLGASGLETDAFVTRDGEVVLDHDGEVGRFFNKRPFSELLRKDLPTHVPTLGELYEHCGTDFELSVDVKDLAAFDGIVEVARRFDAEERLWLCHWEWTELAERRSTTTARLVNSTRLSKIKEGPERRAARLGEAGIDAINLRYADWSGGLTTLFHRFDRYCFGWDAQQPREITELLRMGIDGVFSDHVDRLAESFANER